jgi:hypothetical protein
MQKRVIIFSLAILCALAITLSPLLVSAQEPQPVPPLPSIPQQPPQQPVDTGQPVPLLSAPQLDNLVAPIALYPDPLLSQVLVATTYPLEVVEAYQWQQANPGLTGPALTQAAQQQNWDPSVQALVMFPDVLKQLNQDITWTTNLGNAYLAQPQDVMNSIQQLRLQAQQRGQLASTPQQTVTVADQAGQPEVIIEPANPDVIYVPAYDPTWFWGPAVYYPYPRWYYPRRTAGLFFGFGPGINVGAYFGGGWGGWGGWGWRPQWRSRAVVVNNTFIERNHFNAARIPNRAGTTVWSHDAFHRHGVPYPAQALTQRYRPNVQQNLRPRVPDQARVAPLARIAPRPAPSPGVFARPAPAPRAFSPQTPAFRPPTEQMGNRHVAPNTPSRNRSVFSGIENGGAARSHINRGYSSLGPARAAGPRMAAPSGGRSGGGSGGGSGGRSRGSGSRHR